MIAKKYTSRRKFVKQSGLASIGFLGLQQFVAACSSGGNKEAKEAITSPIKEAVGYGSLQEDPEGILRLPKEFSYKIISRHGDAMTDGFFSPGKPDGMATFAGSDGRVILVRNHENMPDAEFGPFGKNNELLSKLESSQLYDYGFGKKPALGGTTTLVYNEKTGEVETSYLSVAGTTRNCAGGLTPWGSWITCEETVYRSGPEVEVDHGYNFEVPASEQPLLADPVPLKAMGRFNHKAVSVDSVSGIVYQTEDRHDGLIYRFIPNEPGQLQKGGRLQALVIKGEKSKDLRNWDELETSKFPIGQPVEVEWIDLDDVEAPDDDLRMRGFEAGAARFARGEGMWYGAGELYFACTNGGNIKKGQVFRYIPSAYEGTDREAENPGMLELFVEPNDTNIVQNCDNLTVAPWGDVILCEDTANPFVVGVTPLGEFYKLAENVGYSSEFAGGVFSPSGETYFVNIQHAGLTLAITGPWKKTS